MTDLTISVAEILGHPGAYRDFQISASLDGVETALARLDPGEVDARLRAESVVEGVLVTGRAAGPTRLTCARCLEEFGSEIAVEVCELFAGAGHPPEGEDFYEVSGTNINLEPMLRDAITLALPLNPHCSEACPGLCSMCGKELVDGTCTCVAEATDPRWAELESLKDQLT